MRHVQSSMAPGDRVVFTGVPGPLYANVYGVSWPTVTTLEEIEAARAGRGRTWLIYTFPRIISHSQPAVASLIERECQHHRVFRGTVGGGDVMVCALEGYAVLKAVGKGDGVEALKKLLSKRFEGGPRKAETVAQVSVRPVD